MLPALLLAVILSLQTAAGNELLTSPLFGNSVGGDPFDDGTKAVIPHIARLHSVLICHGDWIDGIQLVYVLEDNGTFIASPHGRINENCGENSRMSKIIFMEDEKLVHVEGMVDTYGKWQYVSRLLLFTSVSGQPPVFHGGPFGWSFGSPFSLTGDIRGIFGRNGDVLDAIGFYINTSLPLSSYNKTNLLGGEGGSDFDDLKNLSSRNEKPLKITNMVINYNKFINGIEVTYMVCSGKSATVTHGTLASDNWMGRNSFAFLDFEADEWITRVDVSASSGKGSSLQYVYYLEIETTNSKGSVRLYGPFGQVYSGNITTVVGVVHGFYGRSGDYLDAIGFYI